MKRDLLFRILTEMRSNKIGLEKEGKREMALLNGRINERGQEK